MTKEEKLEFKKYVCGIIAKWMDSEHRPVWTKKRLAETISKALWVIKDPNLKDSWRTRKISQGFMQECFNYLNGTGDYLFIPNVSPAGYVCVLGPRNITPDVLTAVNTIRHSRKKIAGMIESQIVRPAEITIKIAIPAASEIAGLSLHAAELAKKQLTSTSELDDALGALSGMKRIQYKLTPVQEGAV